MLTAIPLKSMLSKMVVTCALCIKVRLHVVFEFFKGGKTIGPCCLACPSHNPIKDRGQHQIGCADRVWKKISTEESQVDKRAGASSSCDGCNEHDFQFIGISIVFRKSSLHLCPCLCALNAVDLSLYFFSKFVIVMKKGQSTTRSNLSSSLRDSCSGKGVKSFGKP